ncbi:FAD binding domain-containing protein [Aromatoleum aromaticum]|uniref:Medium FAD-binding subunit of molybdenum enzyme n=1 Tax=Aromatoleum aromaticum (strain DSM 19018 / LMG 30748 / EbN1) TaxID=76114 RepID=Q5P5Z6_AROAE|nr:xanthine dehydrogenase family protein subunit M [Aromatoleum aromaticum]NMG54297.1 xanthine dehydrogenase family protein subunit M [Aromatoleum aromaticum]CAI07265.1 Medium FAD-binding subunit of molybdenum enzyme [Aromatoleum aromaticum EbN1]
MTPIEQYLAPATLDEAVGILQQGEVTILAGGTDVMPQSKAGRLAIKRTLMNIRRIPELKGIALDNDAIRIGALTTITEILNDPLVKEYLPVLAEACDHFASDQIRNAGTLGGNIGNASPAGDTLVPLIVLDAEVELASKPNGSVTTRRMPLAEFFTGPGKTKRAANELLTAVRIPLPKPGHVARFFKFGTRPALDISAISIGIAGVIDNGVISQARVAFGAVAPTPIRAARTEEALEGRRLDEATIEAVASAARDEVNPIDDVRATAWYRKELIHNMTKRMLDHVAQA